MKVFYKEHDYSEYDERFNSCTDYWSTETFCTEDVATLVGERVMIVRVEA